MKNFSSIFAHGSMREGNGTCHVFVIFGNVHFVKLYNLKHYTNKIFFFFVDAQDNTDCDGYSVLYFDKLTQGRIYLRHDYNYNGYDASGKAGTYTKLFGTIVKNVICREGYW